MKLFQTLVWVLLGIFNVAFGSTLDTISISLENYDEFFAAYQEELARLQSENLTVEELIQSEGYPVETHTVTTTDGYILTLHRIPTGKNGQSNGKIAFVQHGLLCSSADWVIAGSEKSLGYILADEGYDVWLGNARGNTQSRKHISLNPDTDSEFWQFSWHEIGIIDIPQMIDYVLETTGVSSVYHVGHSQGGTTFYVMTSMLPEYNAKIKVHVSLAPGGYLNHMTSPLLKTIALLEGPVPVLTTLLGTDEFLPQSEFIDLLADTVCSNNSVTKVLCSNILFALFGFSPDQMNSTLLPIVMHYTPAGSSTKQVLHYAQEVDSGNFCQYDFGAVQNLVTYGSLTPQDYSLSSVTAPAHLFYSKNDWIVAEVDVSKLCSEIANCVEMNLVADSFNHLDYLYGIDANSLVYNDVVSILNSY